MDISLLNNLCFTNWWGFKNWDVIISLYFEGFPVDYIES